MYLGSLFSVFLPGELFTRVGDSLFWTTSLGMDSTGGVLPSPFAGVLASEMLAMSVPCFHDAALLVGFTQVDAFELDLLTERIGIHSGQQPVEELLGAALRVTPHEVHPLLGYPRLKLVVGRGPGQRLGLEHPGGVAAPWKRWNGPPCGHGVADNLERRHGVGTAQRTKRISPQPFSSLWRNTAHERTNEGFLVY